MGKLRAALFCILILFTLNTFAKDGDATDCETRLTTAVSAAKAFKDYFSTVNDTLFERGGILNMLEVALIAKEHALLMGPPGNAKSMISDIVLGGIKTDKGEPSYYRIQMTPETTMSETHGPISPKDVFETGRIKRHYDQGMLYSRNVFIDEIFDARANAQRNILGLLAERQHAQGTEIVKGEIETVIGATNRYLDEVYEKAGDQGPKALLDRFSFNIYVPGEFQFAESYQKLISSAGKPKAKLPDFTFKQLDELRAMTGKVEVPPAIGEFLSLLSYRIKTQTEAMEQSALKVYRKKQQSGENPPPPYRATKYHSPRTLDKAAKILRAIVVQDWIRTGGKRSLTASVEDLKTLKSFFTLSGPDPEFTQALLDRTVNPYERSQLSAIIQEAQLFDETYLEIAQEMNEVVYRYALADLDGEVSAAASDEEKKELVARISETWLNIKAGGNEAQQAARTGKDVGITVVTDFLEQKLRDLVGAEFESTLQARAHELQERKRLAAIEAKRLADEAAAQQKRKELEARRAQEAAERQARIDAYVQNQLMDSVNGGKLATVANISGAQFTQPVQAYPGQMQMNPVAVVLKDQTLLFPTGATGARIRKDGKIEEFEYAKAVEEPVLRAMLSGNGERTFLPMDEKNFLVKRGNMLAIVDSETLKMVRFVMLESDGKFAVDHEKKYAVNIGMAQNRVERIELATGNIEVLNANLADIAGHFVANVDRALMYDKDQIIVTYVNGRHARTVNLASNQANQFNLHGHNWTWTSLLPSADGKRVAAIMLNGTNLQYVELQTDEMARNTMSSQPPKAINIGINSLTDISGSPTGSHLAVSNGTNEVRIVDVKSGKLAILRSNAGFLQVVQGTTWLSSNRILLKGYDAQHRQSYQILEVKPPTAEELEQISKGE